MLLSKKLAVLLLVVTCGPFAMAQGALKPVAKAATTPKTHHLPWKKAVRLGGLSYVKPNYRLGHEIMNGHKNSYIGSDEHIRFERTVLRTHFLGERISRFIAEQVVNPTEMPPRSFPGFYADFPHTWEAFTARTHSTGGRLEVLLEAAYGDEAQFSGHFVRSFNEVMELAVSPVQYPLSARQALERARREAQEEKTGFFVIRVAGNFRRPKDTLLLDLEHSQYISYNHSLANRWAEEVQTRQKLVEQMPVDREFFPTIQDRRTTQGIILRVDGSNTPKTFAVSENGLSWQEYHLNTQEAFSTRQAEDGINIWVAWNKGYYIKQMGGKWLFAAGPGKPLFNTPKEVEAYQQQQDKSATR